MGIGRRKRLAAKKDIKYGQIPSNGLRGFSARVRVKRKKVCGMMVGLPLCCLDFHSGKYCSRFSNRKTRERERERERERKRERPPCTFYDLMSVQQRSLWRRRRRRRRREGIINWTPMRMRDLR